MACGSSDPDVWDQWSPRAGKACHLSFPSGVDSCPGLRIEPTQAARCTFGTGLGFHRGPIHAGKKTSCPDGLIRVERGGRRWSALVEVKTGRNDLDSEQLETYLDIARDEGFDALITISNQIQTIPGNHPTPVDKRKLRKVALLHWSWSYLLSTAILIKEHRGVSDPEQAWILGELIRYLEHDRSGVLELEDMGPDWVTIRDAITAGTLRKGDEGATEVAARFQALLRFIGLRLGRRLGTEVTQVLTRAERANPMSRTQALAEGLVEAGRIEGAVVIPETVGPLRVETDLRSRQVTCSIEVDAPKEGRSTTRVNWLLRQLQHARGDLRVETYLLRGRGAGAVELLSPAREDPTLLAGDRTKEIKSFRIALVQPMGIKRGRGSGTYIDSVVEAVDLFYGEVVQNLKSWRPRPPRMREPVGVKDDFDSPGLSSQDQDVQSEVPDH